MSGVPTCVYCGKNIEGKPVAKEKRRGRKKAKRTVYYHATCWRRLNGVIARRKYAVTHPYRG